MKPHDLASLRAARLPLIAERLALLADHRGQDEARAEINTYCSNAAAEIKGRLAYSVATGEDLANICSVRARPDGKVDLGPLLAALLGPDKLAASLVRYADALPASTDRTARAQRLAKIAAELDEIEDQEEIEIMRLESLGLSPGRRGDADPAIVLKLRR